MHMHRFNEAEQNCGSYVKGMLESGQPFCAKPGGILLRRDKS
jgi:hypothetical protein